MAPHTMGARGRAAEVKRHQGVANELVWRVIELQRSVVRLINPDLSVWR
jgi:hypothetical protein